MNAVNIHLHGDSSPETVRSQGSVPSSPVPDSSPPCFVRPALVDDAQAIARIQGHALLRFDPSFSDEKSALLQERWKQTLSTRAPAGYCTFVALHAHAVAGFALVVPAPALDAVGIGEGSEIAELLIDPNFTRSGHGSRLLAAIAEHSLETTLRIWVETSDEAKIRFLSSAGFAPAGLKRALEGPSGTFLQHLWWTQVGK